MHPSESITPAAYDASVSEGVVMEPVYYGPIKKGGSGAMSNTGSAQVIQANSRNLPLADNSVDLVVTSPP